MMKDEFAEETRKFPKMRAKVMLCRCSTIPPEERAKNLFGMRIEERNKIWYRTWAFKISEEKAKNEGWDAERFTSSLNALPEYNGCPYCGGFSLAQCSCGKLFCFGNRRRENTNYGTIEMECPWCNQIGVYETVEAFEVQGGSM